MAIAAEVDGKKPGKVQNRQIIAKTRAVVTKFDPPTTWDDLTTDGFSQDLIDRYEVTLRRAGVDLETQSGKGTRYVWPMTKAEAALTGYGFRAKAIIEDLEAGDEDVAVGSVTPEPIVIGSAEIEDGAITYAKIVTQIGSIRIGTTAPSPAKSGDVWYDTNFSPPRLKRYTGSVWEELIKGPDIAASSIAADRLSVANLSAISANLGTINAGSITGVSITGATIRTASSGVFIELSGTTSDTAKWFSGSTELGRVSASLGAFNINTDNELQLTGKQGVFIGGHGVGKEVWLMAGSPLVTTAKVTNTKLWCQGLVVGGEATAPSSTTDVAFYYNPTFGANGAMIFKKSNGNYIAVEFAAGNKSI